ncbi:DUF317 domain-containing protein [Streptomyces sp. IBSBF 2507]|uniref:DUF317 domain-containing protein n=1 Tax=Streptomyces sp. IBSBF 2507 TaxID=2903530 RepID=UPI00351F7C40
MVFAISPCARLWTRFAPKPEERGPDTWTIGMDRAPFGPRAWEITFDARSPWTTSVCGMSWKPPAASPASHRRDVGAPADVPDSGSRGSGERAKGS